MEYINVDGEFIPVSKLNFKEGEPLGKEMDEVIPYPTSLRITNLNDFNTDAYVSRGLIKSRSGNYKYKPEFYSNPYTNKPFVVVMKLDKVLNQLGYYAMFIHEFLSSLNLSVKKADELCENYRAMNLTHGYLITESLNPFVASRKGYDEYETVLDIEEDIFYGISDKPSTTSLYFSILDKHVEHYYLEKIRHSTKPNCKIQGDKIKAIKHIDPMEILSLDLSLTEPKNSLRYNHL